MRKKCMFILQIATCVLLMICMFKISSLEKQIQNMQNNLLNRISNVEQEVGNISYEVSSTLEEEASFLSMDKWSYGNVNAAEKTVELLCEIAPKEYSKETAAELIYKDKKYPLTFENGKYIGTMEIPIFEELYAPIVQFTDSDKVRTEELEWYIYPKSEVLPILFVEAPDAYSYTWENGTAKLTFSYDGSMFVKGNSDEDIKKIKEAYLVECLDGKELARTKFHYDTYSGLCLEDLHLEGSVPFGSVHEVYVEAIDTYGFYHRNIVFRKQVDENGEMLEDHEWYYGAESDIYDGEGNPLYKVEE